MKPPTPHDPLDDLIAAALHGELSPEERAQFESRLSRDPAAQAAYQETQAMHEILESTHRTAQPDPDFEQRMVSAVRRKLAHPPHDETAWESLVVLWKAARRSLGLTTRVLGGRSIWLYSGIVGLFALLVVTSAVYSGSQVKSVFTTITNQLAVASPSGYPLNEIDRLQRTKYPEAERTKKLARDWAVESASKFKEDAERADGLTVNGGLVSSRDSQAASRIYDAQHQVPAADTPASPMNAPLASMDAVPNGSTVAMNERFAAHNAQDAAAKDALQPKPAAIPPASPANPPTPADNRKLIRNAQLDLEVKSYQAAVDQIAALTKAAGGYVDTSNSQRGGNGKLQGTVVVKVLPENLDAFLLKLRDLGEVQNQSVSTDDVTKDYFDTQARLVNSQKMEVQLQDLLKRENGKVSDLLAVERELGRVRGEIEQMQGQLKLYDFQVQYATVTMNLAEKDLNQTAAYLLKEQDNFSLYATDVEGAFQKARDAADQFKAQVLAANLEHDASADNNQVSASLDVMVAPDQIEPFLAAVRGLGRVANFTRQTQRVAKDGGDSSQPADETKTEKDKVRVQVSIRSDDDSRKHVAITVVAKTVDDALDQAKVAALANAGVEILASSLNATPQGASTAQLTVRVPGKEYSTLMDAFRALGRQASLSIQRNDNAGPGASGDDAPVIISLSLTDTDAPVQETDLTLAADDVDAQAQQIKKAAGDAGVEVKASSFERQADGTELAQMSLRLPLGKYPAFLELLKKAGKVESLSVQRTDRPDETQADATAPADIELQVHNERAIVPDNGGLWPTLRDTFGQGFAALFTSVRVIGVVVAFLAPWVFTLILCAWLGRRIYVWRKNR
jgi:hypothetical protein